jgi:hypothetical protein
MNGQLVQHVNTFHHPELKHRFLRGWLGFQDHGAWIRVRNANILEAPGGRGMSAWYKPRPPLATTAVLDRLINPERLSVADGITSAVAYKTISAEESGEHVLANLTGPGAVVRVARAGGEGRLAFYFDGEKEPRIECTPGELKGSLPQVGKDSDPLLTCLTFKRRLKIVLREAAKADYRFDYLKLPGNLPVESFTDPESGFPRGWLPAATTILRWLSSGRFHQNDPLPRVTGQSKTIEPGKTEELARVEGAGIVKQLTLAAPKKVLDNNYVLADQGGPTLFLAMPFGNGLTVSVANRGGRPIPNIKAVLAVQKATKGNQARIAARMRLRGVFQPAQDGASELIDQKGTGRLVGLVYQSPGDEQAGLDTLLIDGRPVPGWSAATLDPFLGQQGDFRKQLSGRQGVLSWRYLFLAPVDFQKSLVLKNDGNRVGERLALFYLKK